MEIAYFVFTNGEDGENKEDWGVKHSSVALGNRKNLDDEYKSLLSEFGMSSERDIPDDGKVNMLLLPYTNGRVLLGYVFPSTDHKRRRSSSSIVCVIPAELQKVGAMEIARRIWDSNDLLIVWSVRLPLPASPTIREEKTQLPLSCVRRGGSGVRSLTTTQRKVLEGVSHPKTHLNPLCLMGEKPGRSLLPSH